MTLPLDDSSATHPGAAAQPQRQLSSADGNHWRVYERAYPAIDRRTGTCLIFESDKVIRRVRDFPPNWRSLSDDELYAISLRA